MDETDCVLKSARPAWGHVAASATPSDESFLKEGMLLSCMHAYS